MGLFASQRLIAEVITVTEAHQCICVGGGGCLVAENGLSTLSTSSFWVSLANEVLGGDLVHQSDEFQTVGDERRKVVAVVGGKRGVRRDSSGGNDAVWQGAGAASSFTKQARPFRCQLGSQRNDGVQQAFHRGNLFGQDWAAEELGPSYGATAELSVFENPALNAGHHIGIGFACVGDEVIRVEMNWGVHTGGQRRESCAVAIHAAVSTFRFLMLARSCLAISIRFSTSPG